MIDHDVLVADTNELAPLPATVIRLLGLLSSDEWSIDSVVETATLDAGLTARVLKTANSAAHGSAAPVATLREATMRLGATAIVKLATGSAMRSVIAGPGTSKSEAGEQSLWRKSVATAIAADLIREYTTAEVAPEAFTIALLNDIGRIVLSRHLEAPTMDLLDQAVTSGDQDPLEAEREILGVDHAELGALIVEHWQLPKLIAESIRFHHRPTEAPDDDVRTLCDIICVSDSIARMVVGEESVMRSFDAGESCDRLGLEEFAFDELRERTAEQLETALAEYE